METTGFLLTEETVEELCCKPEEGKQDDRKTLLLLMQVAHQVQKLNIRGRTLILTSQIVLFELF